MTAFLVVLGIVAVGILVSLVILLLERHEPVHSHEEGEPCTEACGPEVSLQTTAV